MLWPIGIAVIIVLALGLGASSKRSVPLARSADEEEEEEEPLEDAETPAELALRDPVEALLRYGTPADAAGLAEQSVDLSGLGYRPPGSS